MARIRIASFNILHGVRADGSGRVDHDVLGRSAASLRPDVLALQEVDVGVPRSGRTDQARVVAEATGLHPAFAKATRVGGIGRYGNALLARTPPTSVEVVVLPSTRRGHERRVALLADVGPMVIASTHLSIHRPEVHEQLAAVVRALLARAGRRPHVLVGDLNLAPGDVAPLVDGAGMTLAPADEPTFPNGAPRARIDHVAVGGGITVRNVEVVPTASSDHCALVVEVEVP